MKTSTKIILRFFLYFPIGLILIGIVWFKYQEKQYKSAIIRIVTSVSLPDTATFQEYALFLHKQLKPGIKAEDVHKIIKGYSRIDTLHQWPDYYERYRYDLPMIDRFLKPASGVIVIYDSTWTYINLGFED